MKIQTISQWFSLLLLMSVVASCSSFMESIPTPSLVTNTLPISSPSRTKTKPPTLTASPTGTPTTAFTLTTAPTLTAEDARKRLLDVLANNGDCRLPCLWGIVPGKSTYQEAQNILLPLSSIAPPETIYFEPTPLRGVLGGTITPLYLDGDLRLNARIGYLYSNDGIVSNLDFRVREERIVSDTNGNLYGEPIFDFSPFTKRVEYYSLSHVLSEQGIPASAFIEGAGLSFSHPIIPGKLDIVLLYPDQGIWIDYTLVGNYAGDAIRGCPTNAHIQMKLYPPGDPDSFFTFLDQTDWGKIKNGYKPLEEATSMSLEQFYETFRNSSDQCIETPTNLWPTSEP